MEREAHECTCSKLNVTFYAIRISEAITGPPATNLTTLLKDIVNPYM